MFFIANSDKWYWVEVQTTLSNNEIEKKIKDAIWCSDKEKYTEYILIFPKEFEKESLFKAKMLQAEGNAHTNKLRIMLYSDGNFETILEPKDRVVEKGSAADLFGKSI